MYLMYDYCILKSHGLKLNVSPFLDDYMYQKVGVIYFQKYKTLILNSAG